MFYVYILYSADLDIYYKGFSENVDQWLIYHLNSVKKYTSKATDWKLVYSRSLNNAKDDFEKKGVFTVFWFNLKLQLCYKQKKFL